MRRLSLHASALSDAEYDFFTKSLREIADDVEPGTGTATSDDVQFDEISIGVREARAWFRGRYSRVSLPIIDGILKLFTPNLGRQDVIKGTEFFAALRLVTHAENGKEIDRSLAFVQVNPPGRSPSPIKRSLNESRSPSPPTRVAEFLRASSADDDRSSASVIFTDSGIKNPFPISYPMQSPQSQLPELVQHSAFNPFIHPNLSNGNNDAKLPPLPPRKTTFSSSDSHPPLPPPRHAATPRVERSISPSMRYSNTGSTPPIPPKPSQHVTSTLIKQSLQARKIAQSMKKAEEQLDKERVLQVLKSSSIVTGAYPLAGASVVGSSVVIGTNIHNQHQHQHPNAESSSAKSISSGSDGGRRPKVPPLPKRRTGIAPSQQPSPPLSDCSLEQVALASSLPLPEFSLASNAQDYTHTHPRSSNPFTKEDLPNHPLPAPPPMHPDRNPTFGYHQLNPSHKPPSDLPPRLKTQNIETFEAIYGSISPQPISPFRSVSGRNSTNPGGPDPIMTVDSQTRPFRSQSLSHQSPVSQTPLPPPVRRRRPESIQHLGNGTSRSLSRHTSLRSSRGVGHRKSSLSISSTSSFRSQNSSPFTDDSTLHRLNSGVSSSSVGGNESASGVVGSNIQRTIEALHHIHGQLQPKLEKARYKAQAGLSKRGYVRSSVRSSGEESPTAVESEEQESLTRESDSQKRPKGKWLETPIRGPLRAQTEVENGDESGSDEGEWERGRQSNILGRIRPDDTPSNHPYRQYEFDNRRRGVEDEFNGCHSSQGK